MQFPIHSHLAEIKWRFSYFSFSFISCLVIILNYHEAVFFWSTYSFAFVNKSRFITTHIAELFTTFTYINVNIVFFINSLYAYYHCHQFLGSSWYKSQIWFFGHLQVSVFIFLWASIFISYFIVLPYVYTFLDAWTITTTYVFQVNLEARMETYVYWMFQTTYLLANIIYLFLGRVVYFFLTDNMINLHIFHRKNKKYVLFFVCLVFIVALPPENFVQLYYCFYLILFYELLFFFTCLFFAKNNV
uniref:SecY-independent transporter protein n=1 Tax=Pyropia kanakaensis TaxID=139729 RepID=A0A060D7E4_9RHOD|nr:SecY-independent transporter protein [Pyropia kanakaensis]AIB08215.1 SecY-independent transporter protein [Pyropia kanakaensis]